MGDIGTPVRKVDLEPMPESVPIQEPAPVREPVKTGAMQ